MLPITPHSLFLLRVDELDDIRTDGGGEHGGQSNGGVDLISVLNRVHRHNGTSSLCNYIHFTTFLPFFSFVRGFMAEWLLCMFSES